MAHREGKVIKIASEANILGQFGEEGASFFYLVHKFPTLETLLPSHIEHTLLAPAATPADIRNLCLEALEFGFHGVCVHGSHTLFARYLLRGTAVRLVTVIGFPQGCASTETKVFEANDALENGADELDMVMHPGALKYGDESYVIHDISQVKKVMGPRPLKVIIESAVLKPAEIRKACELAMAAGADFIKTSTGFGIGGASIADVALIREIVGDRLGIKASGGIREARQAQDLIDAGASRIGTSSGPILFPETK